MVKAEAGTGAAKAKAKSEAPAAAASALLAKERVIFETPTGLSNARRPKHAPCERPVNRMRRFLPLTGRKPSSFRRHAATAAERVEAAAQAIGEDGVGPPGGRNLGDQRSAIAQMGPLDDDPTQDRPGRGAGKAF